MDSPSDFQFGEDIGEGSWSSVVEAVHCGTRKTYAIKILNKAKLIKEKMTRFAGIEKEALRLLNNGKHPGIVRLYSAFQDTSALYFVLALAPNGDIRELVKRIGSLSLPCARYYSAQILDTVQWIHSQGILHRDLKPENILLDEEMRIKLTDFGSAFIPEDHDLSPRASTFVGSAAYVSPELLSTKTTSQSSDIWAIGCIIYFLLFGKSPFMALTEYLTFKKIEALDYSFPDAADPEAQDIVQKILVLDPSERLGAIPKWSPNDIRNHAFFVGPEEGKTGTYINWETLWTQPPVPIEAGLFKAPPPTEIERNLVNGMQWNDFVNQFSLIEETEEETRTQSEQSAHQGIQDETLHMYDVTSQLQQFNLSPSSPQSLAERFTNGGNVNTSKSKGMMAITQKTLIENHMDASRLPWSFVLFPSESIRLITSAVEVRVSRLFFSKTEHRTLMLTSLPRLICAKVKRRSGKKPSLAVKQEFIFPRSPESKPNGPRLLISGVALLKGANLGVELDDKTYTYTFFDQAEAKQWLGAIQGLLDSLR